MHLRLAQPDDLPELSRIYAASWKHAYRGMMPQAYLDRLPEDFWVPSFSQRLEQGIYTITVAEQQNTLCGGVIYGPSREEALEDWGEICSIYVLPSHMGQGTGSYGYWSKISMPAAFTNATASPLRESAASLSLRACP